MIGAASTPWLKRIGAGRGRENAAVSHSGAALQVRNYMTGYHQVLDGEWNIGAIAKE